VHHVGFHYKDYQDARSAKHGIEKGVSMFLRLFIDDNVVPFKETEYRSFLMS
jgi:hypothetical protein